MEKSKKKVAVVLHGLDSGGIGTLFADLSACWRYDELDVTYFVTLNQGVRQLWYDKIEAQGVRVINLHDLTKRQMIQWPFTIYRALKKYGPFDVVHANMEFQSGIVVTSARLAGVPLRICHGHRPASVKEKDTPFVRLYKRLMRFLMRRNAHFRLACSESAGEYFFGKSAYNVLFNGIDLKRFMDAVPPSPKAPGGYRFITVGRLSEEKNPFFLLDVFEAVHKRRPEATLTWVGTGKLMDEIMRKAEEKGLKDAAQFPGQRKDVEACLKQADYFLFPSKYEAFGLALLEAQAAGLDCFASDTIPPLVDCGKPMFLSLEAGPDVWADRILDYIASEKKMTLDEEKLRQFDIRAMAANLTKLYVTGKMSDSTKRNDSCFSA